MKNLAGRVAASISTRLPTSEPADERLRVYPAIASLQARHGYSSLSASEMRVFSQNGEDGVLAELFHRLGVQVGYFVEFGVESGAECNSRFLSDVLGWRGLLMDANSDTWDDLEARHAQNSRVTIVRTFVTPTNVNDLFSQAGVPEEFDLLSIDIDGQDYWVWKALAGRYRPRVVVIEYNSGLPAGRRLVEREGRETTYPPIGTFGSSLAAITELAEAKGYRFVHADLAGVNAFYVRSDLGVAADPIERAPNYRLEGLRHPPGPEDWDPRVG